VKKTGVIIEFYGGNILAVPHGIHGLSSVPYSLFGHDRKKGLQGSGALKKPGSGIPAL
jgi:hypothetical protein